MRTLLAIAVVFVLAGCAGEAPPLPDIDATVEARLELAKASLVAPTAVPLPTYTPMPAPSPEVVVKEVVVEKEVPVEVEKIVQVEVIKEVQGPERVVTKEVIVEKPVEVEKIVKVVVEKEVVVTATPTQMPTLTVIPTPTLTATPTPTPTATPTPNPLDYISVETSTGTTKAGLKYKDVVIQNTHPSSYIRVSGQVDIVEKDSDGYIVSQSTEYLNPLSNTCLKPNRTYRFRYEDKNRENVTANFEWGRGSQIGPEPCDELIEYIDETLVDEVEIDIERTAAYQFSVEVRNNSEHKIEWGADFIITDEDGYLIWDKRSFPCRVACLNHSGAENTLIVVPNGKQTQELTWFGKDNFVECSAALCGKNTFAPFYIAISMSSSVNQNYVYAYGDFTTDLKLNEATLTTTVLRKVE